jgi:hypothetical protein
VVQLSGTLQECQLLFEASTCSFQSDVYANLMRRSRIKVALRHESSRPWLEVPGYFTESEYRDVRDRQMKELEQEDDTLSKVSIRFVELRTHNARRLIPLLSEI